MLLPDIAGPAHNVALIFISNHNYSLGSYARLVEEMEEGIFKRCACLVQKLIILRKNRPSKGVFAVGVFAVLDRLQKVNWCIIVFVARIIDYDWPRDEGYSASR